MALDSLPDDLPATSGDPGMDFIQGLTIYGPLGFFVIVLATATLRLFNALSESWKSRLTDSQANTRDVLAGLNNTAAALQALTISQERQNQLQEKNVQAQADVAEKLARLTERVTLLESRK